MNLNDFKSAQSVQIKILAFKRLKNMLEGEYVVLSSGSKSDDQLSSVFSEIFGETQKRELDESIKNEMCQMVNVKLDTLNSEFDCIGEAVGK